MKPLHEPPDGWTDKDWADRLRYMASVCDLPDRKAELEAAMEKMNTGETLVLRSEALLRRVAPVPHKEN